MIIAKVHTITGGAKNEDVKAASIYVSDTHVINKMSDTKNYLILDVRSTESYTKGHLKGSLSLHFLTKITNFRMILQKHLQNM